MEEDEDDEEVAAGAEEASTRDCPGVDCVPATCSDIRVLVSVVGSAMIMSGSAVSSTAEAVPGSVVLLLVRSCGVVAALSLPACLAVASTAMMARVEARGERFVVVGRDSSTAPQASSSSSFMWS